MDLRSRKAKDPCTLANQIPISRLVSRGLLARLLVEIVPIALHYNVVVFLILQVDVDTVRAVHCLRRDAEWPATPNTVEPQRRDEHQCISLPRNRELSEAARWSDLEQGADEAPLDYRVARFRKEAKAVLVADPLMILRPGKVGNS